MLKAIESGQIGAVIVKDMSRLGRDYLQVGYFTDRYFPDNNVRFVAINDGVDSSEGENEFAPFRNIMNEWRTFSKDKKTQPTSGLGGAIPNEPDIYNEWDTGFASIPLFFVTIPDISRYIICPPEWRDYEFRILSQPAIGAIHLLSDS